MLEELCNGRGEGRAARAMAGSRSLSKVGSSLLSSRLLCRPVQVTLQCVGTLWPSCWLSRVGNTALPVGASPAKGKKAPSLKKVSVLCCPHGRGHALSLKLNSLQHFKKKDKMIRSASLTAKKMLDMKQILVVLTNLVYSALFSVFYTL